MVAQVSADAVLDALTKKSLVLIVDVRTPAEYAKGKIEGSINIPVDQVGTRLPALIPDKTTTIFLYCLSGSRSDAAVQTLSGLGYGNAKSMTNGLLMWRSKKYPLIP